MSPLAGPGAFGEPPSTTLVDFGAESRPGRSRSVNEDHYAIIQLGRHQETVLTSLPGGLIPGRFDEYGYAMVVADGLGTCGTAESASRLAIATLVQLVLHFGKWNLRIDDAIAAEIMTRAEYFYRYVDTTVLRHGETARANAAQTTLTAAFGAGSDLFFAHVGHSRAYLCREGQFLRLTRDHTVAQHSGHLAPLVDVSDAARDLEHIITNTIGMAGSEGPQLDLERITICDGDRVLVCTNGLTDTVAERDIATVVSSAARPSDQARTLVDLATAAGSEDDVTALVASYQVPAR
jgi:serine/threonine protein phosphatase PrpC